MARALTEAPDVVLDQVVYAGWNREKAEEQAAWLFERYTDARIVWAASDVMAFGAMKAWERRGGKPGRDAWFSGVNTSKEAFDALHEGRLAAVAGGHFITGAWSLVMIYDYAHGRDFKDEGLELDRPMFTLFDDASARRFVELYGDGFGRIDFRRYSKALNPGLRKYNFDFGQLLK
jgi:ABC-type sugar transport system substrate-binding protein